jgi:hypothetical protein
MSSKIFSEGTMGVIRNFKICISLVFLLLIGCTQEQPYSPDVTPGKIVGFIKPAIAKIDAVLIQGMTKQTTSTDSTGYYEFNSVAAGIYNIKISAKNFGSQMINNIIVYAGQTTAVHDVLLKPYPEQLDGSFPVDGAEDFPLTDPIQINFSTLMDHKSVENSFYLFPDQSGRFQWATISDRSKLSFYPNDQFISNLNYLLVITTDARTIYGDSLSFEFQMTFKTEGLKITSTIPADGATYVSPQTYIYINFNSKMDRESLENNFIITPVKLGNFKWIDSQQFCFQPGSYFASNTLYQVSIIDGARDIYKTYLRSDEVFFFQTEPLTINSNFPAHGASNVSRSSPIIISFNTLVSQESVEDAFSVIPAIEGWDFQWSDLTRFQYLGTSKLLENTYYTVTLDTTCTDAWGNKLTKNFTCIFRTGN